MNQTARISLQILSISKSEETKSTGCALTSLARPASSATYCFRRVALASPPRPVLRPARALVCASAPPVKGLLRIPAATRKSFLQKHANFFPELVSLNKSCSSNTQNYNPTLPSVTILRTQITAKPGNAPFPHKYSQTHQKKPIPNSNTYPPNSEKERIESDSRRVPSLSDIGSCAPQRPVGRR